MRITHVNLVDAVTYITPSSADADYPITNIQDQRLSTKWKSDTASTQTVIIDLGSAQDITTLVASGTPSALISLRSPLPELMRRFGTGGLHNE